MQPESTCPKCASEHIIRNLRIVDRTLEEGWGATINDLKLEILTKPNARIRKGAVGIPLSANVCGNCGYTELYVKDINKLLEALNTQT